MTLLEAIALSLSRVLKQTQNTLFTFRRNFIVCVNCGEHSWTKVDADSIFALKSAQFNSNQTKIANETGKRKISFNICCTSNDELDGTFFWFCSSHGDRFFDVFSRSLSTKCQLSNIWQTQLLLAWRDVGPHFSTEREIWISWENEIQNMLKKNTLWAMYIPIIMY